MRRESYPAPLFLFLSLLSALAFVSAGSMTTMAGLLLGVHILLHWYAFRVPWVLYVLVQSLLLGFVPWLSGNTSLVVTLAAWLVGESVAMPSSSVRRVAVPVWFLILSILLIALLEDPAGARDWISAAVPTMVFVLLIMMMYARESRARQTAEELSRELADANKRVADYARSAERERMARDLHDTLAQGLTGIVLQVEVALSNQARGDHGLVTGTLQRVLEQARTTLRESRDSIQDLRHGDRVVAWDELVERIRSQAARADHTAGATTVTCTAVGPHKSGVLLPESCAREVEAIVGEALSNARVHAHAAGISVTLETKNERLFVRIVDDGTGFDPEESYTPRGHFGIHGMRERAAQAGGVLSIDSARGFGTTVTVALPCERSESRV